MLRFRKTAFFLSAMMIAVCGSALAHNVSVFAWVEGDTVHVEGKFGSGRKPVNAPVKVYDPEENLLLAGTTDKNGEFSFKVPRQIEMKVVLEAGMGHRGEWTIPLSDLEGVDTAAGPVGPQQPVDPGREPAKDIDETAADTSKPAEYVTAADLQEAIETALDKKLKPVMKLLVASQQDSPSLTDILGGIGYIFGLVGVAAYVSSRRRGKS